jgi:hypothetical protein
MDPHGLELFATKYTAAWCSQQAAQVASFFAEHGSLTEEWTLGADGLIAESQGHFDQAEYSRQLATA